MRLAYFVWGEPGTSDQFEIIDTRYVEYARKKLRPSDKKLKVSLMAKYFPFHFALVAGVYFPKRRIKRRKVYELPFSERKMRQYRAIIRKSFQK